jgi:hypothetical protein
LCLRAPLDAWRIVGTGARWTRVCEPEADDRAARRAEKGADRGASNRGRSMAAEDEQPKAMVR